MAADESMLQRMHRRQFIDTSGVLLDWYAGTCSSEVTSAVREQKTKLHGLVVGNDERERECLHVWHSSMKEPLPPTVRYAAALKRIIGSDGTGYHACEYNDMVGLLSASHAESLISLGFDEFVDRPEAPRKTLWDLIKQMNSHTLQYYGASPVIVPSREEIHSNIKAHKASKTPSRPVVERGFDSCIQELAQSMGARPISDWGERAHESWTEAVKGGVLSEICKARDVQRLRSFKFSDLRLHNLFDCAPDDSYTDETWTLIDKLNSLTAVQDGIPANMMKTIESKAQALASEIALGKTDMSKINLADLGQSVLEQCDIADVESMATNMSSLLPMLQGLQLPNGQVNPLSACALSAPPRNAHS